MSVLDLLDPAEGAELPDRRTLLDPGQQADLERLGFARVPLLTEAELAEVRRDHRRMGVAPDDPQVAINWTFHSRSSSHKHVVKEHFGATVGARLLRLLDDHRIYLTTFITKWPGEHGAFAPHQDPTLVDERRFRGVTVWMPLDEVGPENGMLYVVPGSHRFSRALRFPDVDRFQFAEHERSIIERHGVGVPLAPGEALVFDNRLLHHSLPNETSEPRVVLSFGVHPAEGACVITRHGPDGEVLLFEVPDDFFIDVLPADQHNWRPQTEPIARLRPVVRRWSPEEFDRLCAEGLRGTPAWLRPSAPQVRWSDPGAICAMCGGSEGLDAGDRVGRNNAQLICARCLPRVDAAVSAQRT